MKLFAHRGVYDLAPENTIPAFERAIALGADGIEFDVRLTADRVPVVIHDSSLGRTTSAFGAVGRSTLAQVKAARFRAVRGADAYIPTLREALEALAGRIELQIELKGNDPETAARAGEILQAFRPDWEGMEIISFEPELLQAFHDAVPGLQTGLLTAPHGFWIRPERVIARALERASEARAGALHLNASQLSERTAGEIRMRGIALHAWGVNSERRCRAALGSGAVSICTDDVPRMARCVREAAGTG
ncbi:MAG: glycerophosphodiester phosphodiesterase [Anaerolineales bacterium]|nr:glycerophosphodiester phosphodiesterase [Anaerolineales bacterium]